MNHGGRLLPKTSLLARVQRHSAMATLFRSANQTALHDLPMAHGALPAVGYLSLHSILPVEVNAVVIESVAGMQPEWSEAQIDSLQPPMVQPEQSPIPQQATIGQSAIMSRPRPAQPAEPTGMVDLSEPLQPSSTTTHVQTSEDKEDPQQVELRRLMDLHEHNQGGSAQRQPATRTGESPAQQGRNIRAESKPDRLAAKRVAAQDSSSTAIKPAPLGTGLPMRPALTIQSKPGAAPHPVTRSESASAPTVTIFTQRRQSGQSSQIQSSASEQVSQNESTLVRQNQEIVPHQPSPLRVKETSNPQPAIASLESTSPAQTTAQREAADWEDEGVRQGAQAAQWEAALTSATNPKAQKPMLGSAEDLPSAPTGDLIQPSRELSTESALAVDRTFERLPLEEALQVQPAYFPQVGVATQPAKTPVLQREEVHPSTASDAAMPPETEAKLRQVLERIPARENSEMGVELILPRRPRPQPPQPNTQPVVQSTNETLQRTSHETITTENAPLKEVGIAGRATSEEQTFTESMPRPAATTNAQSIRPDPKLLQLLSLPPPKTNVAAADNQQAVEAHPAVTSAAGDGYDRNIDIGDTIAATPAQRQIVQTFRSGDWPADGTQESIKELETEYTFEGQQYTEHEVAEGTQGSLTATDESFNDRNAVDSIFSGTVARQEPQQSSAKLNLLQRSLEETEKPGNKMQNGEHVHVTSPKERESRERPIDVMALAHEVYAQLKHLLWIERERLGK